MFSIEANEAPALAQHPKSQYTAAFERLQQLQEQLDDVVDIMHTKMRNLLDRDQKLSEMAVRADELQQGPSQFEQQTGKLMKSSSIEGSEALVQRMETSNWLQQLQAQVDDVMDIMRKNVKNLLERDQKLSDMANRGDVHQQEASQIEQQAEKHVKMSITEGSLTSTQQIPSSNWLQQLQAQIDDIVAVMRTHVKKLLEEDHKLSDMGNQADVLQQGASQFEQTERHVKMSTNEKSVAAAQQMVSSNWLQQLQNQVDDAVDFMRTNMKKLLEEDQELSEMADRVDTFQQVEFEQHNGKLIKMSTIEGNEAPPQHAVASNELKYLEAQVDDALDIMRNNVKKLLERDKKLSEMADRAVSVQKGASQFKQQARKLTKPPITEGNEAPPQHIAASSGLKHLQAQVDDALDIMRSNVEKLLERDKKLSEMADRAVTVQKGASQFKQQARKLTRISTTEGNEAPAQLSAASNGLKHL